MKILISTAFYYPHVSGLTNSIKNLAEALVNKGYEITIITTQYKKNILKKDNLNKVNIIRIPYFFKISKGFFMPSFFLSVYNSAKNTDAVVINLPQFEGVLVALIAKLLKKKVYCIYACEVILKKSISSKIIEKLLRLSNKICLNLADKIVTLTDDFAVNNKILMAQDKEVHSIFPIIYSPRISLQEIEVLRRKIPKKKHLIGFIGRISSEKGIEYLLETVPLLQKKFGDNFAIIIAGPLGVGEDFYKKTFFSFINKHHDSAVWLQELTDNQLGAFYKLIDVLVLPSINNTEAFGMVQVEAMFCGTPVVTTDLPGVRVPVLKTKMGEIVPTKNPDDLSKAIIKTIEKRPDYIKRQNFAKSYFSTKKILSQWENIFKA